MQRRKTKWIKFMDLLDKVFLCHDDDDDDSRVQICHDLNVYNLKSSDFKNF